MLLDFRAAFNLVDHTLLLIKLSAYGFESSAVNFMRSYLADIKHVLSSTVPFQSGLILHLEFHKGAVWGL